MRKKVQLCRFLILDFKDLSSVLPNDCSCMRRVIYRIYALGNIDQFKRQHIIYDISRRLYDMFFKNLSLRPMLFTFL